MVGYPMGESKRRKKLGLEKPREVKMNKKVYCKNCECLILHEGEIDGVCHRNPPTPLLIPIQNAILEKADQPKVGLGMNFYWPRLRPDKPDAFCFEGIPKP
jgi:hypothetical protein